MKGLGLGCRGKCGGAGQIQRGRGKREGEKGEEQESRPKMLGKAFLF